MEYSFKFGNWYLPISNFKLKNVQDFDISLSKSTVANKVKFIGYANIEKNKINCEYIGEVTMLSSFVRGKTNCLVYDIIQTGKEEYDKIFIYCCSGPKELLYLGVTICNTVTGKYANTCKDAISSDIIKFIKQVLNGYYRNKILKFYSNKYDEVKAKTFGISTSIKAYDDLINEIRKEQKAEYKREYVYGR